MIRRPVPTGHEKLGPQVNEWIAQWRADRELLEALEANRDLLAEADPRPMGTNRVWREYAASAYHAVISHAGNANKGAIELASIAAELATAMLAETVKRGRL